MAQAKTEEEKLKEQFEGPAFGCFSSRHKFCREICPTYQVTRNESHTSYGFHASMVAIARGLASVADVAADFRFCTMCGACENRCPNTLFTGDFYRNRTRTIDLVRNVRAAAHSLGISDPAWQDWNERTQLHKNEPVWEGAKPQPDDWARGLNLPKGGETILFCDCEAAHHRTSVPQAIARLLQTAGVPFGLMFEQWCCGGPAYEMGFIDQARAFASHNVQDWRRAGAKRILCVDPHDYIHFTEDYPNLLGSEAMRDFEIVHIVELLDELIRDGRIRLTERIPLRVTYHDPCRLNKRKGIHEAPRRILRAIPGLDFVDVDHVTQWAFCSGGGGGVPIALPELAKEISTRRIRKAEELQVDALVSACVWAERPLSERRADGTTNLRIYDIVELVAVSAGVLDGAGIGL